MLVLTMVMSLCGCSKNNDKKYYADDMLGNNVKIGDYIKFISDANKYTISTNLTGYSKKQIIKPSELVIWRVIKNSR